MRSAMILPILLLAGCQVSKDGNNDSVTVGYNQDVAENAVADVSNTAENIAADIGNDVERTADKIDNKVDGTDHNAADNAQANTH
jgi:hypothetical protein